jgi:periplasmic copper chaperone A
MLITEFRTGLALLLALGLFGCSRPEPQAPAANADHATMDHGAEAAIAVHEPWARPTSPIATVGAAYMTIMNHGMGPDRLLGASTPVAAEVQLHASLDDNGVMRMRPVEALEIAPHGSAKMDPGGMHFMLMQLTAPLVAGSHFPLTLKFERAGEVTVDIVVQDGAGAHAHAG